MAIALRAPFRVRRMKFEDVMAYKHQRDIQRREGLKELTRFSQELGLYDLDYKFDQEDNH